MRPLRLFLFLATAWLAGTLAHAAIPPAEEGYIGCKLAQKKGSDLLWVDYVAVGGPAEEAGIKKGDCILAINGVSTEKMSPETARRHINGRIGAAVTMTFRRDGMPDTDLDVVRRSLPLTYTKAADAGDAVAQYSLGYYYAYNQAEPDPAKAVELFRKAAEQGYPWAQFQLGYRMKFGYGTPIDVPGGVEWYRKAAQQGIVAAERDLGLSYMQGEGVPKSDKDAFAWLYTAAVRDDATAEHNLAYLYRSGRGVARDDKAAYAWYYRSAQQYNYYGEWGLGYMYARGLGVKKDPDEALKWYHKAELGLPKNETLKQAIVFAKLQAFLESPNSKSLDIASIRTAFFWPLVIGLYALTGIYIISGVILLCYSMRKPDPPGVLVALAWIVFYFESQFLATASVMFTGNQLLADVLVGAIALFGAVPVIISTMGVSRARVWQAPSLSWPALLGYGLAFLLVLFGFEFVHDKVYSLVAHSPLPPQSSMALFEKSKDASPWITLACLALVIPIAEEVMFRSYLFDAFRPYMSGTATIFVTAFLFAFAHFQLLYFIPLFVMGLVFGLCRLKTGSIRPSIFLHVLNNALVLAAFH